jgi:asparagine synthase (glutamine-hydrolysing)
LKKALEGILPNEVLYRSKKGFGIPAAEWWRSGKLRIDDVQFPTLNGELITSKLAAHISGKTDEAAFLWCFYVLKRWREANNSSAAMQNE